MSKDNAPRKKFSEAFSVLSDEQLRRKGVIRTGDVEPRQTVWLWGKRIPLRTVTVLAGVGGQGKSQITDWLAAELSKGRMTGEVENTLILSAEDPIAEVLHPRLHAAGADQNHTHTLTTGIGADADIVLPRDLDNGSLEHIIRSLNVRMLVIDPIVAYIDVTTDSHKSQDVRRMLKQLAAVAERANIAVVIVMHFKKGESGVHIMHQISGAAEWGNAVRSALMVTTDPRWEGPQHEAPFVLWHTKNNYGPMQPPMAYHIEGFKYPYRPGVKIETSRIVWDGEEPALSVADAFSAKPGPDPEARQQAEEFLRSVLQAGSEHQKKIQTMGQEAGISPSTLKRAKKSLGIQSIPFHNDKGVITGWMWASPGDQTRSTQKS